MCRSRKGCQSDGGRPVITRWLVIGVERAGVRVLALLSARFFVLLQRFCVVPEVGLEPTRGCPHRIF